MTYTELEKAIDDILNFIEEDAECYEEFKDKDPKELANMALYSALKQYKEVVF